MINPLRRILPRAGFLRNVATLTGATAISQLMVLAALPVLTRLYAPADFGAAAVYAGLVGLIVVIATFRYELAIPLPRRDRAAFHVVFVSFLALAVVTMCAGLASVVLYSWLGQETGLPQWAFSSLILIGVVTTGAYQVVNYWAVRKSKFGAVASTRIQQGLAGTGSQIALGLAGFGITGLIVGQIIGQCAGAASLAAGMLADSRTFGARIHRRGVAWAAKRYRRFPLYDSWAGLFNVAGGQAPILLFAALFSPVLAGYYAVAHRILSAPLGLVGRAISQVLLPRIVEANRRGDAAPLLLNLLGILAWVSFFPFTAVALLAHDFVSLALGAHWEPASAVVAWTALWAAWQFVTSPLSIVMVALEAQGLHTLVQMLLFALRVGGILAGVAMASPEFAVAAFTMASVVGYAAYLLAIFWVSRVDLKRVPMVLLGPIAHSALFAAATIFVAGQAGLARLGVVLVFGVAWTVLMYRSLKTPALRDTSRQ